MTGERRPEDNAKEDNAKEVPYYVKACALGIPAYLIGVHLWTWVFNVHYFLAGRADFRQLYTAGYLLRTGHRNQLYDYALQTRFENLLAGFSNTPLPFNHLAYESLLFAPLSFANYRTAYLVWLLINISLLAICFALLRPWTRNLAGIYRWLPLALFAAYLPIAAALIQGQDSIILLTLFTAAFVLLERGRESAAGALVGLGLFKFELALPIALLFVLWRRWKFTAGFAASACLALLLSIGLVGFAQSRVYLHMLGTMSVGSVPAENIRNAITPNHMPNLRGLLYGIANTRIPPSALQAITIVASLGLLLWVGIKNKRDQSPVTLLIAITTATLVSYHLLIHDLSVVFVPLLVALDVSIPTQSSNKIDQRLAAATGLAFCASLAESFFPDYLYLASIPIMIFLGCLMSRALTQQATEAFTNNENDIPRAPNLHSPVL